MRRPTRSTPSGEHRPVLLEEVLHALAPQPGEKVVDATLGFAGHSEELLKRVGPTGLLIACDFDPDNLPRAEARLAPLGYPYRLHQGNFAGIPSFMAEDGIEAVDMLLADLGMSSMQVDDPERGFSYVRDGPLDMRMDRTRGRTAAQLLEILSAEEIARALTSLGDEPEAETIAKAIVQAREETPLTRTTELARLILKATTGSSGAPWTLRPAPGKWTSHPAARTFQALRILVNREIANLEHLLRVLPSVLRPGGRAAIISFHSGEDRLVKGAFRDGVAAGIYERISSEPIRATFHEKTANPRSRSAKLRWAIRGS